MNSILSCRQSFVNLKNAGYFVKLRPIVFREPCKLLYSVEKAETHVPNTVDKLLLVWWKKYPSVKEVPNRVSSAMMEKVRNKSRIKINIYMCIATAIICVFMIFSGKRAAQRGESVKKMNQKWHEEENAKK